MSRRVQSLAHIILLMALSWLLVAWIGAREPTASQSPVLPGDSSPVPTTVIAIPIHGISPMPTSQAPLPDPRPDESPLPVGVPPGLFPEASPIAPSAAPGARVWSSPLPWIGVGVLVFGVAAWAALSTGRRAGKGE